MTHAVTGLFAQFLKERIQPWFKERGYRQKANSFGRWVGDQFLVVNFQTVPQWIQEDPSQYPFTVNLGVFARKLHTAFPYKTVPAFPAEHLCHWRERLDALVPVSRDPGDPWRGWWGLRDESQFDSLADEVLGLLATIGLPMLERLSTEEGLRDYWLEHRSGGVFSDLQAFRYLVVLIRKNGPREELDRLVSEMRTKWKGTDWESRLENEIQMLGL